MSDRVPIPAPEDPELRAQWEAAVAARKAAGLGTFVGDPGTVVAGKPSKRGAVATFLDLAAIGAWFGVSGATVSQWRSRYADFPVADVVIGRTPGWAPSREAEIRRWEASRPGRGAGGGRSAWRSWTQRPASQLPE